MNTFYRNILLMALMTLGSVLTILIHPTHIIADEGPLMNLEAMIPKQFGDWAVNEKVIYQQVNPELQASLDKIYSQLLTRTYVNSKGYNIMLTIPYGKNQSDGLSVHDPEGCYPAQGFQILSKSKDVLHNAISSIPVRRMEALSGSRHELLTYWYTVGNHAVNNDWDRKKAQMQYSLKGEIPDGVLVRVSSVDTNTQEAYRVQALFIEEMIKALATESRQRISGLSS